MTAALAAWTPCSGLETFDGLVWLPRLVQKARRLSSGADLMGEYMFGDSDAIDRPVLAFLKTDDRTVLDLVAAHSNDADVARILVAQSGSTRQEREAFSASLKRKFFNFALLEADEGRMPPGMRASALRFLYNRVLMPGFAAAFRRAESRRMDRLRRSPQ